MEILPRYSNEIEVVSGNLSIMVREDWNGSLDVRLKDKENGIVECPVKSAIDGINWKDRVRFSIKEKKGE